MIPHIKIAFVGAPEVGKTSFIRRFATNEYVAGKKSTSNTNTRHRNLNAVSSDCLKTDKEDLSKEFNLYKQFKNELQASKYSDKRPNYDTCSIKACVMKPDKKRCPVTKCCVMYKQPNAESFPSECLLDLTLIDVPYISRFPSNSFEEWDENEAIGVRSADAYILLYDITQRSSFEYIQQFRQDVLESFCDLPQTQSSTAEHKTSFRWTKSKMHHPNPRSELFLNASNDIIKHHGSSSWGTTFKKKKFYCMESDASVQSTSTMKKGFLGLLSTSVAQAAAPITTLNSTNIGLLNCRYSLPCAKKKTPLITVVGNKMDLCSSQFCSSQIPIQKCTSYQNFQIDMKPFLHKRATSANKVLHVVRKSWSCHYFECSVKFGCNVYPAVKQTLDLVFQRINKRLK
ncbi:uncharacterized protein LOC143462855 [Clavelina lepadiformis]|uniref:Uncharacterized protein n=1 Tax=Clavelina lepadiformis TaxID=159417 RepID=A0ABP0GKC2_CLALP